MKLIEPCCAERHVRELRNALGSGGSREIEGYGDLSLTELLPAILTRYYEAEVLIAAPSVPDQAAEAIATWMRRSIARMDGRGRMNYIARLTIVADLSPELSPMASGWLRENPFPGRLTLIGSAQEDTALLMPDFAILGPVNMRYGRHFTATATTVREQVEEQWRKFTALADEKPADGKEPSEEEGGADGEAGNEGEPDGTDGADGTASPAVRQDDVPRRDKRRMPVRR